MVYSLSRFERIAVVHFSYSITKGFWPNIKESDFNGIKQLNN
jgi:hypothetical protein